MTEPAADVPQPPAQLIDVVAAIHHPVRRRLLELLHLDGPNTVSGLAEAAQERVGNASHHLKVLAEAGLVEAAPELAKDRREHWWRAVGRGGVSWSIADVVGDPLAVVIASAAEQQNLAHHVARVQQWFARREELRHRLGACRVQHRQLDQCDPGELAELSKRVNALFSRVRRQAGAAGRPSSGAGLRVRSRCSGQALKD